MTRLLRHLLGVGVLAATTAGTDASGLVTSRTGPHLDAESLNARGKLVRKVLGTLRQGLLGGGL